MSALFKSSFHLRPLLRGATTTNTLPPDYFTSNALRHHLPLNGGKTSLVAQGSNLPGGSYTSPNGNTGSAGYNGGAGAGGGYTGHARAFLSLSQSSVDPSASLNDEKKKQNELAAQQSLLLQHRMSKRTQLVQLEQASPGRQVRAQIEGRKGSRRVSVVQIEDGEVEGEGPGRRGIAYDQPWEEAGAWQLGGGEGARQIGGARVMSTDARSRASSPARRRAVAGSSSDVRVIGQPNRVLMDLAGVDMPLGAGSRLGGVRRNSTAAVERPSLDSPPDALLFATPGQSEAGEVGESEEDVRRTNAIIEAIGTAVEEKHAETVNSLVDYYRSPRTPGLGTDSGLSSVLPLPSGYSLEGFNACLKAVLASRPKNGTVAPILEMYNLILAEGLLPDSTTYECVMRALIRREVEVNDAARTWEEQKKWGKWRSGLFKDESWDAYHEAQRDDLMEQYRREYSLQNALKLFRASAGMGMAREFPGSLFQELLFGVVATRKPKTDTVEAVIELGKEAGHEVTPWTKYLFLSNGLYGNRAALNTLWDQFEAGTVGTDSAVAHLWENFTVEAEGQPGLRRTREEAELVRASVWTAAVVSFARAGNTARARQIFDRMVATAAYCQESGEDADYSRAPAAKPRTFSELIKALAVYGDPDTALAQYTELAASPVLARMEYGYFSREAVTSVIQALALRQPVNAPLNPSVALDAARLLFGEYPGVPATEVELTSDWGLVRRVYTLLVATVAQGGTNLPESERIALLSYAGRCIEMNGITIDPELAQGHAIGLIELGHEHLAPAVIRKVKPVGSNQYMHRSQTAAALVAKHAVKQSLRLRLELAEAWARRSVAVTRTVAELIVEQYTVERGNRAPGAVLAPRMENGVEMEPRVDNQLWFKLIEAFATIPHEQVMDGELDAVLVQLMEDLAVVYPVGGENSIDKVKENKMVGKIVELLAWRFGVERAVALLEPIYGDAARGMVTPPAPEPASPTATAESPSSDSAPDSESTDATSIPSSDPKLVISPAWTHSIERFMAHNPTLTPLQAYEILQDGLRRGGNVPRVTTLLALMDHLARAHEEEKVRELYDLANVVLRTLVPPAGQAHTWYLISNAMLSACCHLGHLEEAGMHRAGIVEAGFAPSADAYATMIASSKDTTDDALVARELWEEAMARGVQPHLFMYNTMISKLGKARKAEMALELFTRLKAEMKPSSVTYGAVINACCKVGDALSAETLFEEMVSCRNFRARVPPYNTMMQFYLNTQPNRERVLHYYQALLHARVPPSAHTYKLLLDAYGTLAPVDFPAMEQTFQQLVANRKVGVQGTHYASLISAYGANPETFEKARHVFESVPLKKGDAVLKDAVVWESWLGVLARKGDINGMESAHAEMLASSHIQPTAYVYNVLITGYAAAGQMDKARGVFESMGDSVAGVAAPNNHPALLTSSGHVKPTTTTAGAEGQSDVVYREPSTYETMIRAEKEHGTRENAELVLKRMEERGYPPAVYMRAVAVLEGENAAPVV
ncbi:hypothetical protein IAT38_005587 [Cryptococcus sp. DSM 104549]